MSVAIYTKNDKQSNRWLEILRKELPSRKIEIYPEISEFEEVSLLICWKPYEGLIDKFPNLKAIQSLGAGVDHIFHKNKISASLQISKIVDSQLTQDMWEHILSVVLADMKNLFIYDQRQKDKEWKPKRYKRFNDVTIGILGMGRIGSYVANQFCRLGAEVLGWSGTRKEIDGVSTFTGRNGLYSVSSQSDYLINILPLTNETTGILNIDLFAQLKPNSYLINVGRGPHLVDQDLLKCLDAGLIRGVALDVFHKEPLPANHTFWSHPKIRITPHIASLTYIDSVYPQVVENIRRLDSGKPLLNTIDVEKGY